MQLCAETVILLETCGFLGAAEKAVEEGESFISWGRRRGQQCESPGGAGGRRGYTGRGPAPCVALRPSGRAWMQWAPGQKAQ